MAISSTDLIMIIMFPSVGLDNFKSYDVRVAAFTKEGAVGPYSSLIVGDLTECKTPMA